MKKEGKVTTLLVEDARDFKSSLIDFDGDVEVITIVPSKDMNLNDLTSQMRDITLYKIVPKNDPNLTEVGINLDYHAIDPIKVTDAVFTDPDNLLINGGTVKLPWDSDNRDVAVVGGIFLDEELATELCLDLNAHTADRVDEMAKRIARAQKFRRDIANDSMS